MKVIVGLGNPGRQYERTRHNIGFAAIDYIAGKNQIEISSKKHKALIGSGYLGGQKVLLVKPQTFMNLSGESLRGVMDFYKLEPSDFIVIFDDISLDVGQLRIRRKGSAGGHNGIKDLIKQLGTQKFVRIKVGVGAKPQGWDLADHVLGRFDTQQRKLVDEAQERAAKAVEMILSRGTDAAMNEFNKKTGVV